MVIQQVSVIDNWDYEGELYELVESPIESEEDEDKKLLIVLIEGITESGIPFILNTGNSFKKWITSISDIYIKIPSPPPELT